MTSSSPVSNSITISAIPWGSSPLSICNGLPSQLLSLLASSAMPLLSKSSVLPSLVYLERPQGRQGDHQGRHEERREHVRHAHLPEVQEDQAEAPEQDAPVAVVARIMVSVNTPSSSPAESVNRSE